MYSGVGMIHEVQSGTTASARALRPSYPSVPDFGVPEFGVTEVKVTDLWFSKKGWRAEISSRAHR